MSYNTTCHLSKLLIKENENVIAIPVIYSSIKHTTTLCYNTNESAYPIWLPIKGKYNGYGSICSIDNDNTSNRLFLNHINNKLFKKTEKNKLFNTNTLFIFKDKNNQPAYGEFIYDSVAKEKSENTDNLYLMSEFDNLEHFFDLVSLRAIFNISGEVSRLGFILIKESIFNKIVDVDLDSLKNKLKNTISEFCDVKSKANFLLNKDKSISEEKYFEMSDEAYISEDFLHNNVLGQFNGSRGLTNKIKLELTIYWQKNNAPNNHELIQSLLLSAYSNILFQKLGQSFYPNTSRSGDCKTIMNLNNIVNSEIKNINKQNIQELIDNGYNLDSEEDSDMFRDCLYKDW